MMATPALLLPQVPLAISLSIVVKPGHISGEPSTTPGRLLTVTAVAAVQPGKEVNVMVSTPGEKPLTTPEPAPTLAIMLLLLLQLPATASVRLTIDDTQTLVAPVIPGGNGFTTTVVVVIQPAGIV
jgi:hypothetical protein